MPIRAVSHIAVGVSDMERALAFYRDVLGLAVSYDGIEEFAQTGTLGPHRRRGVYLRWSKGDQESFLVLDQHDRTIPSAPRDMFELGIHHFAFWVDDIDQIFARAVAHGCTIMVEPSDNDSSLYGEPSGTTIRTALIRDPDGNIVQLDQRITGRGNGP